MALNAGGSLALKQSDNNPTLGVGIEQIALIFFPCLLRGRNVHCHLEAFMVQDLALPPTWQESSVFGVV